MFPSTCSSTHCEVGGPTPGAGKKLQLHVHRLRRALGEPGRIRFENSGYALRVESASVVRSLPSHLLSYLASVLTPADGEQRQCGRRGTICFIEPIDPGSAGSLSVATTQLRTRLATGTCCMVSAYLANCDEVGDRAQVEPPYGCRWLAYPTGCRWRPRDGYSGPSGRSPGSGAAGGAAVTGCGGRSAPGRRRRRARWRDLPRLDGAGRRAVREKSVGDWVLLERIRAREPGQPRGGRW